MSIAPVARRRRGSGGGSTRSRALPPGSRGPPRGGGVHHHRDAPAGAEPDEHDEPAAARDHRALGDGPGEVPRGVDVQAVDRPPALGRDGLRRRDELAAGVVHEHVDPAEPVQDGVDQRGDLVGFADVGAGDRQDLSAGRRELGRDFREGLGPPAGDRDARAGARVLACDRSPRPVPPPVTRATSPSFASGASGERYASDMRAHDDRGDPRHAFHLVGIARASGA